MAALPAPILPRVASLLRMLGSDQDGEALGAARALQRTLGGVGLDLHALADVVEHPAAPETPCRRERRPRRPQHPGDVILDFMRRRSVVEALRRGLAGDRMSDWETEFATSILVRLQGGRGRLTERQGETLGRLLHKMGEGSAWV